MSAAAHADLVPLALRAPHDLPGWPVPRWEMLVRQARRAGLLARLASTVERQGLLDAVPSQPRVHLRAALTLARAQETEVRREVQHLLAALEPLQVPVVLLKGAAYLMAGLAPCAGRLFGDVDVLVPRDRLAEVEAALMMHGWATTHHSPYDQRYYRQWMHELPPLRHMRRHTVLDVHHAILPLTARLRPRADLLIAAATPLEPQGALHVLAPADMALHAMAHLFLNEDVGSGLRDLVDIDALLRQFGSQAGFWGHLAARAEALELSTPLRDALHHAGRVLGTPVPAEITARVGASRSRAGHALLDVLWARLLRSPHDSTSNGLTSLCRTALYVRAHWMRMPPALLCRHLAVKAAERWRPVAAQA